MTRQSALVVPAIANSLGFNSACEVLYSGKTAAFAATPDAMLHLIGLFRIDTMVAASGRRSELAEIKESKA
jgi:hypothetical protein